MKDRRAFIEANTVLRAPSLVPEVRLHLADEALDLWHKTEEELAQDGLPPPFWAFGWAGGQALARYILDAPQEFAGRRVLDLGAGGGLAAIAAAKVGASVTANDVDDFALAAIALNVAANGVSVAVREGDILDQRAEADVVLVGDLFYERALAERVLAFMRRAQADGATVLVGDPSRTYLPKETLAAIATYNVPTPLALEDADVKRTSVFTLSPSS